MGDVMKKINLREINYGSIIVKLVLIYALVGFVIYPNVNLLISIFYSNGEFSTDAFGKIIASPRALKSLLNSFILAVSMVVTVNVIGVLVVLFSEYFDIKGAKILKAGYMTSLIYSGITLVVGYKLVYGSNGVITNIIVNLFPNFDIYWFEGYGAVIFIMTFACTSNHIMFLSSAIRGIDYHIIEASKNMGASSIKTFMQVVFPTLKPTLFAVTILTFLTGLSALSAPLVVGGQDFQTINPMIISFARSSSSQDLSAVLAIILGVATIILLMFFTRIEKKGNYISLSKTRAKLIKQKIENPLLNAAAHIVAWLLWLVYMIPVFVVIILSFTEPVAVQMGQISIDNLTVSNYMKLFSSSEVIEPYLVSITYSLIAAILAAFISIVVARIVHKSKNKLNMIFEYSVLLPWLLPATLIALGMILTYNLPKIFSFNTILVGTSIIMLIAYTVVKLPFSYRMIKASFYSINPELEEAAKSMGSGTFRTMRKVIVPIIIPVVLSVIVINFNSMLAEYDLSVFLYNPFLEPLGVVIKNSGDATASAESQAMVFVYSVIIMVISSISLYFAQGDGISKISAKIKKKAKNK